MDWWSHCPRMAIDLPNKDPLFLKGGEGGNSHTAMIIWHHLCHYCQINRQWRSPCCKLPAHQHRKEGRKASTCKHKCKNVEYINIYIYLIVREMWQVSWCGCVHPLQVNDVPCAWEVQSLNPRAPPWCCLWTDIQYLTQKYSVPESKIRMFLSRV